MTSQTLTRITARSFRKAHAFTLIELLLVVVLIAVTVATMVPQLSASIKAWQVEQDCRNVLAAVRLAAAIATQSQTPSLFVINPKKKTFRVLRGGIAGDGNRQPVTGATLDINTRILQLDGFEQNGNEKMLFFRPDGKTNQAKIVLGVKNDSTGCNEIVVEDTGLATSRRLSADE